jgi:L,D-peptidoglycan transpeptidase YkuD (ErfK/YbiS/YcfS/YnhG family)
MLPVRASRIDDGWCDDPVASRYNRPVRLPFAGSHERMWRQDRLYDLGLVIDYNLRPAHKGRGSAIFIHIMASGKTPTAGCVALHPADLRRLLPRLASGCLITIG